MRFLLQHTLIRCWCSLIFLCSLLSWSLTFTCSFSCWDNWLCNWSYAAVSISFTAFSAWLQRSWLCCSNRDWKGTWQKISTINPTNFPFQKPCSISNHTRCYVPKSWKIWYWLKRKQIYQIETEPIYFIVYILCIYFQSFIFSLAFIHRLKQ